MRFIYRAYLRIKCFLGYHDWLISEEQVVYDADRKIAELITALMMLGIFGVMASFPIAILLYLPERSIDQYHPARALSLLQVMPPISALVALAAGVILTYVRRSSRRMDARCLRCDATLLDATLYTRKRVEATAWLDKIKSADKNDNG